MKIISHRGNIKGKETSLYGENHPSSIRQAISLGYDVEIDVRMDGKKIALGHDKPEFEVSSDFFWNDRMWVHCKNIEAFNYFINNKAVNCFYHDKDDATLTSRGHIWTYPNPIIPLTSNSVAVLPEISLTEAGDKEEWFFNQLEKCYGVCTDDCIGFSNVLG